MIGTVLAEIKASAQADLPGHIAAVAALRGVTLSSAHQLHDWEQEESELLRSLNPSVLGVLWERSRVGVRKTFGGHRHAEHPIRFVYAYKGTDLAVIRTHMLYIAEAMVKWLEEFPTASRSAGKTITQVTPPDEGFDIEPTLVSVRAEAGDEKKFTWIWAFDLAATFRATDAI